MTNTTPQLVEYYARRAHEYERIYDKPERQAELAWLRERLPRLFAGSCLLELACGTGYWTQFLAPVAKSVVACDINEPVLEIARTKLLPGNKVDFRIADAFNLQAVEGRFDAAFAGFWWSHVAHADGRRFLDGLAARLPSGAKIAMLDNRFVSGSSTPISRRDAQGNTYQMRPLLSGETHEILKNFPTADELRATLAPYAQSAVLEETPHYWLVHFTLK
jgi:SAM-dependent methyltransferase